MKDLKVDLIDTQKQNDELRNMIESLTQQVVSLGGKFFGLSRLWSIMLCRGAKKIGMLNYSFKLFPRSPEQYIKETYLTRIDNQKNPIWNRSQLHL